MCSGCNSNTNLYFSLELFDLSLQGLGCSISRRKRGLGLTGAICSYRYCRCGLLGECALPPLPQLHLQNLFLLFRSSQFRGQLLWFDKQTDLLG